MAHTKVSVNRKYYGKVPLDKNGNAVPKNLWPKRRKSSWEVRWYDSEGKRLSKSFKDRKEAYAYSRKIQDKVDIGRADKCSKITLKNFALEHKKLMVGQVAHSTLKDQMRALNLFKEHVGDDVLLEKISPRHAESFVSYRFGEKLAAATVNKDIRTLKSIFNRAINPRGYLTEGTNPFEKIKQRKLADKPPKYVSPEKFAGVYESANNLWWKVFFSVAYTTAGRRDEILNLTWLDIDFENQTVRFSPKEASTRILSWEPKDHESRMIPVPEEIILLLAKLQAESDEGNPYVFIETNRLNHILRRREAGTWESDFELVNNLTRSIQLICKRAEVESFTPHDLRRSCITNWARKLPIQVVQQLAGHSNIATTRKYYLSVQSSDLNSARLIQSEVMSQLTNY
jgi:integrase